MVKITVPRSGEVNIPKATTHREFVLVYTQKVISTKSERKLPYYRKLTPSEIKVLEINAT